ncbi:MAG TPA: hypothetical protein VK337_06035 [Xanthobacteraceae bacterium]|nr:hypothetical protein [Xanthobacteraceae bacterium]
MPEPVERAKVWKRVTAAVLDFFTVFFVCGYALASITGGVNSNGFKVTGAPALGLLALIVLYFYVLRTYAGGTLWDRIFGIKRPQPPD